MNNKNYIIYLKNRKWSDDTIPEGIEIIADEFGLDLSEKNCKIEVTSFYEDTKLAADLKITIGNWVYMVSYRSRKMKYLFNYPLDVTLRYVNKKGYETEYAKIMKKKCGHFNLYTFTNNGKIIRWILINLAGLRKGHYLDKDKNIYLPKKYVKFEIRSNVDIDDTDFIAYNMLSFKRNDEFLAPEDKVIIAHSPGYFDDIKITKLPTANGKFIEMYKLKKKADRIDNY